jgi:hypothetical protein
MSRIVSKTGPSWSGIGIGLLATFASTGSALAAPGDHVRAGVVTIVPRVDLGVAYHSNIYRTEENPSPAMSGEITPGVSVSAGADDHSFAVDGSWTLQKYLFVGGEEVPAGGASSRIANLDRFDNFSVSASADLFKRSIVGLKLSDDLARRNWAIDAEDAPVPYATQTRNAVNAGLRTNPAPALEVTPALAWTYDNYLAPVLVDGQDRTLNSRHMIGPRLDAKWAFLPRTALVSRVEYSYNSWAQDTLGARLVGEELPIADSNIVRARLGIDGRFTERILAQAFVGFGAGIAAGTATGPADVNLAPIDGLLATVQLKYAIVTKTEQTKGTTLSLGYVKDFRTSLFTNFVAVNQLFADFRGGFDDFEPFLRYEARFENYDGAVDRSDLVNVIKGGVAWVPAEYVNVHGDIGYLTRTSTSDDIEYNDVALGLGATFLY